MAMLHLSAWYNSLLSGDSAECRTVSVIGSGGKTSLIWHLAASLSPGRRILVSPSTKMFVPERKFYNWYFSGTLPIPAPGITLAGIHSRASGKLESYPLKVLGQIIPDYDLALIEADGSGGLPLKAWNDAEPVVPSCTGLTIGVLPIWPLGKPLTGKIAFRRELFSSLTGASEGELLAMEHMVKLIAGGNAGEEDMPALSGSGKTSLPGLFAKARGKKILFLSQIEDEESIVLARELAGLLPADFRAGLYGIIAGSVKEDTLEILHQPL